ncbi:MAG: phosphate ABC transporter permease subunit PstC [Candidatus Improbicoccus devescovinae]|nr:MAG: phosphate ABC transporter permease subunit PstC [Candidatus Improbicoccus devescovinae]
MKITKNYENHEKKDLKFWSYILSLVSIFSSIIFLNLPFGIKINEKLYNIFLIKIPFFSGFLYEFDSSSNIIKIPLYIKIFSIILFFSILYTIVLLLFNKPKLAFLCNILIFLFIFSIIFIKKILNSSNYVINIINFNNIIISLIFLFSSQIFIILSRGFQKAGEIFFNIIACFSVGAVSCMIIYIFFMGVPAIFEIGLFNFIFGMIWKPSQNLFGIFPFIISSIIAVLAAMMLGAPIGVCAAMFSAEFAPKKLAIFLRVISRLLAGIPSIVFGFFGMLIIVPAIRKIFPNQTSGDSLLAGIITLAIMILPTIINISEDAIRSVPRAYKEAALSLGDTEAKTTFKIILPNAIPGIMAGIVLGVSRAIGETMAMIMVTGNIARMPEILRPVRLLTTGISLEMAYSSGLHRRALFSIGLILFLFVFIINLIFMNISKKRVKF